MTSDRSTPCGNCGCRRDDHFESRGVCDLGFCSSRCSTFEEPHDDIDLPVGYRWATAEETEMGGMDIPGAMLVTRTFDSTGKRYTEGEADLAVPVATDIDFEPCCRAYTQRLGGGDHEWGCPNY